MVEMLIMDFAFELIREAGIRLPGAIGGTIGIVGGIIIGQAAVEAGLVSPIVVIIVALTGICSFAIPSVSFVNGYRLSKYLLIFLAGAFGLFGFWLGLITLLIHLVSLKSFGIPYMFPFSSGEMNDYNDVKDSLVRMPLFMMKRRPIFARPGGEVRLNPPETGNKHAKE
jgi:spore germination protein